MPDLGDDIFGDNGDNEDSDGAPVEDPSASPTDPKSAEKRIAALQSARDKETARANKAEKQLKALLSANDGDTGMPPTVSPAGGGVNEAILEMARMFAVQQNPKLAEYDITAADLTGNSPAEIARSANELVAKYEKIETRARNKVLAENGMAPELEGAGEPVPERDFSKMSSEDFKKLMDAAMTGQRL